MTMALVSKHDSHESDLNRTNVVNDNATYSENADAYVAIPVNEDNRLTYNVNTKQVIIYTVQNPVHIPTTDDEIKINNEGIRKCSSWWCCIDS